jgi:hypothetical protein
VLKTVPGVLVDRVNVAGNESGQQSGFVSKGSLPSDTQWNLDGVVITDVNSNGASSSYFDFDAFEEINVSTGEVKLSPGLFKQFTVRKGKSDSATTQPTTSSQANATNGAGGPTTNASGAGSPAKQAASAAVPSANPPPADTGKGAPAPARAAPKPLPKPPQGGNTAKGSM